MIERCSHIKVDASVDARLSSRPARRSDLGRLLATGVLAGVVAMTAASAPALGAPERPRDEAMCVATLKNAKAREQEGALQAAKGLFRSCAQAPCSTFVRQQCATRHTRLELDMPTVVLLVSDAAGAPRVDVQVRVDGVPFVAQIDGRALPIDPGLHDFAFAADGHVFATQKILIVQGQRNRFITAVIGRTGGGAIDADAAAGPTERQVATLPPEIRPGPRVVHPRATARAGAPGGANGAAATGTETAPAGEAPPSTGGRRLRVLPWVLTGVGVASLGAGALITTWGRRDNDNLAQCAPSCDPATLSHIRGIYRAADVAIGVGIAALGAAYWVYAVSHGSPDEGHGAETAALGFGVAPTRAGGFALVSGGF